MKHLLLLSLSALAAASVVEGCGAPDVDIAQNADAGKAGEPGAGTTQQSAGTTSVNQTGGNSNGGSSIASAGTTAAGGAAGKSATGGQSSISSAAGAGGELVDAGGAGGTGGAGGETSGSCAGTAPLCFGNNTANCCGNDPAGQAVCQGGKWMCFGAPAPGCSGDRCTDLFACGPTLKCNETKAYCKALVGGIGGDQYQCVAFPASCQQAPSCGCIASAACQSCTPNAAGGITQSCEVG